MLMCRNVAAGIGSNEQGGIVERLCSDLIAKNRDINGLLYFYGCLKFFPKRLGIFNQFLHTY